MAQSQFYHDDINIADWRILIYLLDKTTGESEFVVDLSNIAISDISIVKERNKPDSCSVTIEYTQFKNKLEYEGSQPENIMMPLLTEIKVQRNFRTVFAGTLYHMELSLGEIGSEQLTLKCLGWGELLAKRYVSGAFVGSYPSIARQIVSAAQHEMNWFDNYAFEYSDDYFQGWHWSGKTDEQEAPPRSNSAHWGGGVYLLNGQSMWTYSMASHDLTNNDLSLPQMTFNFWYRNSGAGTVRLEMLAADNESNPSTVLLTYNANVGQNSNWVQFKGTIPASNISSKVRWLRITAVGMNIDISDFELYTKPVDNDIYDLNITNGVIDAGEHKYRTDRIRHYHSELAKDILYDIANLTTDNGDTFEYEFDENKKFNIYYLQGSNIADPAMTAEYPGNVKSMKIERGLEDIYNLNYAKAQEQKTIKNADGNETTTTRVWTGAYSSPSSLSRFGVMAAKNSYDSINSYNSLDTAATSDLSVFDEVQNVPEIEVDSNIYNAGNVFLGDTLIVNVLTDSMFQFINGTYRVYKYQVNVSQDAVETMSLTLLPPGIAALQLISFPTAYKNLSNDVRRLLNN